MFGSALDKAFNAYTKLFVILLVFFPLGLWKAGEIILWIWQHIEWKGGA